ALQSIGEETLRFLQDSVGIGKDDVVLEIGCGIGRVGKVVAPLCRKWIGCDVASSMLSLTAECKERSLNSAREKNLMASNSRHLPEARYWRVVAPGRTRNPANRNSVPQQASRHVQTTTTAIPM